MTFIKNNREIIVLTLVIVGMFVMAAAIGIDFRGGNPSLYWGR